MLNVRVDGTWLRAIGPHADVTFAHAWPHGSEQLSWSMAPTLRRPIIDRGGARVEGFVGGVRTWWGKLAEPSAEGQYVAKGAWSEAAGVYAVDGSGNATNVPDTAIDAAIARGALTWTRPASLSAVAWGTAAQPMRLLDLLDQAMDGLGKRWWVDASGAVRAAADPTTPSYVVPQTGAGRGLTLAEDDYYSNLVGTYLTAGPAYATINAHVTRAGATSTNPADGDNPAKDRWGYREAFVDLSDMGVITAGTATTELGGRLALTGARMQFAETLQVGYGQITTPGGTPVSLATPTFGEMVRLMGVTDNSRPTGSIPYTDIVIGRSTYTDGAPTTNLQPVGMAARNLEEVLVRGAAA